MLELDYFKKLFSDLEPIVKEAAQHEINKYEKIENQSDEEFQKMRDTVKKLYVLQVFIKGIRGDNYISDSVSIFNEAQLPDNITQIVFDSSIRYQYQTNINPQNMLKILFDFSKPDLFDIMEKPSLATPNISNIDVQGQNETWVIGTFDKIYSSLKEFETKRNLIHRKGIYDFFLWITFFPIIFWNLNKIDHYFNFLLLELSTILRTGVFVFLFFFYLMIFWMFFKYIRWLFPYLELKTKKKKGAVKHRFYLITLGFMLVSGLIEDLIRWIF